MDDMLETFEAILLKQSERTSHEDIKDAEKLQEISVLYRKILLKIRHEKFLRLKVISKILLFLF